LAATNGSAWRPSTTAEVAGSDKPVSVILGGHEVSVTHAYCGRPMQIKGLDDIRTDIDALEELASRPEVDVAMRQRIELRLRFLKAGAKAEQDAEYEIEFYARKRSDVVTIHGLRIECEGRTAAIDHLIMNRRLQIWLCESKSVSEAVHITEDGEWWRSFRGERQEMPSPIEQNHHHVEVLEDVFSSGLVSLKTSVERLRPRIKTLVVISKRGRIVRPPVGSQVEGLDTVIKCDLLMSKIKRANEESIAAPVVSIQHVVSTETLKVLARSWYRCMHQRNETGQPDLVLPQKH